MSDSDQFPPENLPSYTGGGRGPIDASGRPGELEDTLRRITDQLSDADHRHCNALDEVYEHLVQMGGRGRSVRTTPSGELAFERSQGVSAVTEPNLPADGARSVDQDANAKTISRAAVGNKSSLCQQGVAQPAPATALKSAPVPAMDVMAAPTQPATGRPGAGAFDLFDFRTGDQASATSAPWESDAAKALARLYARREIAPTSQAAPAPAPAAPIVASGAQQSRSSQSTESGIPAKIADKTAVASLSEREWFEQQLSDLAARLERSLADWRSDRSLAVLGDRLDQFEERFNSALEGMATRVDVEGLRIVEAHLSELIAHVDSAHDQLAKLGSIESQLRTVAQHLAGAPAQTQATAEFDSRLGTLIETTADRVAARMTASLPAMPAGPDRIETLNKLIQDYVAEQRRGKEQSTMALETIQDALVRLIDRVESFDRPVPQHERPVSPERPSQPPEAKHPCPPTAVAAEAKTNPDSDFYSKSQSKVSVAAQSGSTEAPDLRPVDKSTLGATTTANPGTSSSDLPPAVRRAVAAPSTRAGRPPGTGRGERQDSSKAPDRESFSGTSTRVRSKVTAKGPAQGEVVAASSPSRVVPGKGGDDAKLTRSSARPWLQLLAFAFLLAGAGYLLVDRAGVLWHPLKLEGRLGTVQLKPEPSVPDLGATTKPSESTSTEPVLRRTGAGEERRLNEAPADASKSDQGPLSNPVQPKAPTQTTTDELTQNAAAEQGMAVPSNGAGTGAAKSVPLGITVEQSATPPQPEDIVRSQQSNQMATMSSRLGTQVGKPVSETGVSAIPAALSAEADAATYGQGSGAAGSIQMQDLPPASLGPLSLRVAAAKGDPSAEFEVAGRFAEGKGVKQDFKQAFVWYLKAAARGFAPAQYRLGTLFERGLGEKTDLAKARVWYRRAADQGNVKAMHNLAVLSASRESNTPDYPTAAHWFNEAAERGLADSQYNLGVLYENGLGVAKDAKQAYKWFFLAARNGDNEAARRRDLLKSRLQPAELQGMEDALAAWQPRPVDVQVNDARAAGEAWKSRVE
jgi:localization factor PodJL